MLGISNASNVILVTSNDVQRYASNLMVSNFLIISKASNVIPEVSNDVLCYTGNIVCLMLC